MLVLLMLTNTAWATDDFSGPYVGIKAGYSEYKNKGSGSFVDDGFSQPNNLAHIWDDVSEEKSNDKAFAGLEAGYNWQKDKVVYGVAADFYFINSDSQSSGTRDNFTDNSPLISGTELTGNTYSFNRKDKMEWLSTIRGKIGYKINNLLPYKKINFLIGLPINIYLLPLYIYCFKSPNL